MNTDPIADLLTRIRNADSAHHQSINVPYSTMKKNILKVMKKYKFIENYEINQDNKHKTIDITLKEDREKITLKRISKPGQRIYIKSKDLKIIKSGLGISILSTPKGLMSNIEARKENLGGEIICQIS